jgi:hypothetical protein
MSDALMQTLLARLGGGGSEPFAPADALSALASSDPTLAPLVGYLQQRLATPTVIEGHAEEVPEPAPDQRQRTKDLVQLSRKMFAELTELRARNDSLALALGACHLCWGEDADCPYCGGDGGVGAFVIETELFDDVVGPALEQYRGRPRPARPHGSKEGGQNASLEKI